MASAYKVVVVLFIEVIKLKNAMKGFFFRLVQVFLVFVFSFLFA